MTRQKRAPRGAADGKRKGLRAQEAARSLRELRRELRAHLAAAEGMLKRVSRRRMFAAEDFESFEAFVLAELAAHMPSAAEALLARAPAPEVAPPPPSSPPAPAPISEPVRRVPTAPPAALEVPAVFGDLPADAALPEPIPEPAPDPAPAPPVRTAARRLMIAAVVVLLASFIGTSGALVLNARVRSEHEAAAEPSTHAKPAASIHAPSPHASGAAHAEPPAARAEHPEPPTTASATVSPSAPPDLDPDLKSLVEMTQRLPQPSPVTSADSAGAPHTHGH